MMGLRTSHRCSLTQHRARNASQTACKRIRLAPKRHSSWKQCSLSKKPRLNVIERLPHLLVVLRLRSLQLKLYLCLSTAAHIRFLLLLRFLEGYFPVLAGQAKLVVEDGAAQGRNSGGGESSVGESASETGVPANYRDDEAEVSCERRHEERAAVLRT